MGEKKDKVLGQTLCLCPVCVKLAPSQIVERNNSIFLVKNCEKHGKQEVMREEVASWYNSRKDYDKPGTPTKNQKESEKGCPFDCGICPAHKQHTCIGLIEVTNKCDLSCPVCYASSGKGKALSLSKIEEMMDFYQKVENGKAEILQISGGEPTTHPNIIEIIKKAKEKKFKYVMLNTNGIRIAKDLEFVKELEKLKGGFEIYLQFDGFDSKVHEKIRGKDLNKIKEQAIKNLTERKIPITLVVTVEKDSNCHEIGNIIDYAIKTPFIRGVNIQPLTHFGRLRKDMHHDNALTLTGVLSKIESQTNGMIKMNDFIPLPCNVERVAITYLYRSKNEFIPITRNLKIKNYLEILDNTFAFDGDEIISKTKNCKSLSFKTCCGFIKDIRPLLPKEFIKKTEKEKVTFVDENTFRISVTSFLDVYNFDIDSVKKECVHIMTPELNRIPFSTYNMLYRQNAA